MFLPNIQQLPQEPAFLVVKALMFFSLLHFQQMLIFVCHDLLIPSGMSQAFFLKICWLPWHEQLRYSPIQVIPFFAQAIFQGLLFLPVFYLSAVLF